MIDLLSFLAFSMLKSPMVICRFSVSDLSNKYFIRYDEDFPEPMTKIFRIMALYE